MLEGQVVLAFAGLGVLKGQTFPNRIITSVFFSIMRMSRRKISGLIFQTVHDRDYVGARFAIEDIRQEITVGSGVNLENSNARLIKQIIFQLSLPAGCSWIKVCRIIWRLRNM